MENNVSNKDDGGQCLLVVLAIIGFLTISYFVESGQISVWWLVVYIIAAIP